MFDLKIMAGMATALFVAMLLGASLIAVRGQAPAFTPSDENPEDFPEGAGRDDTFYACTACHNFKLVAAQGMTRRQWEESLLWMTQKHNMPVLADKDRAIVLNYLEAAFPPRTPARAGGWQNPFTNR